MKKENMTTTEMTERRISHAIDVAAPEAFDRINSECSSGSGSADADVYTIPRKRRISRRILSQVVAAAAAFLLIAVCVYGIMPKNKTNTAYATVLLDVNPSIELKVDKDNRVISVTPLNDDAKLIVEGLDFSGSTVEVAVNAIVGSMLKHGYLTEIANSILISVESDDAEAGEKLKNRLTEEVNALLTEMSVNGQVLSQFVDVANKSLAQLASEYGITDGKAQFIQSIIDAGMPYSFSDLAGLSISDLNSIFRGETVVVPSGAPQTLISEDEAKAIALNHALVDEGDITNYRIKLENEHDVWEYEIEFDTAEYEYDYEINAVTGEIIKSEREPIGSGHHSTPRPTAAPQTLISEAEAKRIALADAGVTEGEIVNYESKLDYDDGIYVYEIEFDAADYEFEYDINAVTGEIVKSEREPIGSGGYSTPRPTDAPQTLISEAEAKSIALSHAGVSAGDISNYEIKLDRDDGVYVYEIEFETSSYEYEYEINAVTGEIIKSEREPIGSGHHSTPKPTNPPQTLISEDEAKNIALNHAGVSASEIRHYEIELDRDDGVYVYEIDFETSSYEYEYEINAVTGAIIKAEREPRENSNPTTPKPTAAPQTLIGEDEAKSIALAHAGVTEGEIRHYEIKLDRDDGIYVYEIEFDTASYEYDYEINAATGAIIESDREGIESAPQNGNYITEDEALAIALARVNLNANQISGLGIELTEDDGITVYEIEFRSGGAEYEFTVNAVTGAVIDMEIDD